MLFGHTQRYDWKMLQNGKGGNEMWKEPEKCKLSSLLLCLKIYFGCLFYPHFLVVLYTQQLGI